jgi:pseudaminic acid synthase
MIIKKTAKKIFFNKKEIISQKKKCFIVAEISANHGGKIDILKKTILKAKNIGVDAVKIQSYEADTMTLDVRNEHFLINDNSIWKGHYLYDLYKKAQTPFKWHKEIFDFAKKNNIILFSAPFDLTSLEILENLNCPFYKIASPEIEDLSLIEKVSKTRKPIIISTGIANDKMIKNAINVCLKNNNYKIVLLNCISSYPAKDKELNLNYLDHLKKFTHLVGYSDHSQSDHAILTSVAKGAKLIEKHFILNKDLNTPDKLFSYDPAQFKKLIVNIRKIEEMLGSEKIDKRKILDGKCKTITRSIFYCQNIKKGEMISDKNIKSVRPGTGLNLIYFKKIIGKKVKKNCFRGQPVRKEDF